MLATMTDWTTDNLTPQQAARVAFLIWVLRRTPWPDGLTASDLDLRALAQDLMSQRLLGRAVTRLRQTSHHPLGTSFVTSLATQKSVITRGAAQRREQARAVVALAGSKLVFLRGFTTRVHSGDPDSDRYSHDLDVMSEDPDALSDIFRRAGYEEQSVDAANEHAFFQKAGARVEIHRYIPVARYARGVAPAGTCHWQGAEERWEEQGIGWADLSAYTGVVQNGAAAGLPITSLPMATLILCAHCFRTFLFHGFRIANGRGETPSVLLQDLADIAVMAARPDFPMTVFQALITRHGAEDAVRFARFLIRRLCQRSDPFPFLATVGEEEEQAPETSDLMMVVRQGLPFPRPLLHTPRLRFGWVAGDSIADLINPPALAPDICLLKPVTIPVTAPDEEPHEVSVASMASGEDTLVWGTPSKQREETCPEDFSIAAVTDGSEFRLLLRFSEGKDNDPFTAGTPLRILLHFGHDTALGADIVFSRQGRPSVVTASGTATLRRIANGYEVALSCPAATLHTVSGSGCSKPEGSAYALLCVRYDDTRSESRQVMFTLGVPLQFLGNSG